MTRHIDALIVGQGLAGSILAWTLRARGRSLLVLDDAHRSAASTAAAGLVNPLAGMRFGLGEHTADWLASAEAFYRDLGEHLGGRLLQRIDMLRLFRSERQIRFWQRRAEDPRARGLLGPRFDRPNDLEPVGDAIRAPYGGFVQNRTGYVDVPRLLAGIRDRLRQENSWRQAVVDYAELLPDGEGVRWRDIRAGVVIWCEGYRAQVNPWFDWLPFQPDKGEILTLRSQAPLSRHIVNGAHWLLPLVDGDYRLGATHEHHRLDETPTPEARTELLLGLSGLLRHAPDCRVIEHRAGVRPATRDRLPLLGRHPDRPTLVLFNGFGARGSLTIPWYAERLADHLFDGAALPAEVDLRRHARQ